MSSTITLRGIEVELDSDLGRRFVTDATRAAESVISDQDLMEEYELSPTDLQALANVKTVQRAIRDERTRRVRSGLAAKELASGYFVNAPGRLNKIMMDEQANPRHVIESIRELRQVALPESQNTPSQSDRFIITINLGADHVEHYDKSIAVSPSDGAPAQLTERPKLSKRQPKLVTSNNETEPFQGFENDD